MQPALPVVAAVEMGYGHLRAAHALATELGTEVLHVDRPPLVAAEELRLWRASRRFYEITSRASQVPVVGAPLRSLLESLTDIPHLHPQRDLSSPNLQVRSLNRLVEKGLGRGLADHLRATGAPLVATFFAPALSAQFHGCEQVFCVVTDVDINRAWVPLEPARSRIVYLTPSYRAVHRLRAYGVAREHIEYTGFPLPPELLGGPDLPALRGNLAGRLVRLDRKRVFRDQTRGEIHHFLGGLPEDQEGRPPLLTYTVGGAGAQADLARPLLRGLRELIEEDRLRLCLSAGVRSEIAARFHEWVRKAELSDRLGHGVEVFSAPTLEDYFPRFNALLAATDVLWTKPSEMTFFSALGLPLVFSAPVGVHERYNRRWAIENGPGLKQRDPAQASYWLREWLNDGTLAGAAWTGFVRMPKFGLYQILERVTGASRRD
ncbi:MAG TPA: hypothetical protein VIA62_23230 [Thermoanaerobaculia bacterium]|jgi:hypothetical protein|nr:hypothetical protein [Thermoanaerobaculia bacterium]